MRINDLLKVTQLEDRLEFRSFVSEFYSLSTCLAASESSQSAFRISKPRGEKQVIAQCQAVGSSQ